MNQKAYLFVNLGTPEEPTAAAVRKYLQEFLMDDEVIDIPTPLRFALVYGIIGPFRAPRSAHAYQSIWTDEGSPLLSISRKFMDKLRKQSENGRHYFFACRYGNPSLPSVLQEIAAKGYRDLHIFPLYPQFASSTWLTLQKRVVQLVQKRRMRLQVTMQRPYFFEPEYIQALASSAANQLSAEDHLLFSFHGIPLRQCAKPVIRQTCKFNDDCCLQKSNKSDFCYRSHCLWTARDVTKHLALPDARWSVAFQSRLGKAKWLEPYTSEHVNELLKAGKKNLAVICPAFVADCLETLEEINMQLREQFISGGGESFKLIPCLNDSDEWIAACQKMLERTHRHDMFVNTLI